MRFGDFADQAVGTEHAKLPCHFGSAATFLVGGCSGCAVKEGAQIPIAKAIDGKLGNCSITLGQRRCVRAARRRTKASSHPCPVLLIFSGSFFLRRARV